jgi:hypothetical protein
MTKNVDKMTENIDFIKQSPARIGDSQHTYLVRLGYGRSLHKYCLHFCVYNWDVNILTVGNLDVDILTFGNLDVNILTIGKLDVDGIRDTCDVIGSKPVHYYVHVNLVCCDLFNCHFLSSQ